MRFSVGKVHHALFSDNTVLTVGIYHEGSLAFLCCSIIRAAIAFPGVLLYGLFCFDKESLLPVSITSVQFTRHND